MSTFGKKIIQEGEALKKLESEAEKNPKDPHLKAFKSKSKSKFSDSEYQEYLRGIESRKKEHLEWQKEQAKVKRIRATERKRKRERREIAEPLKDIKIQQVQEKDPTGTAYKKAIGNIASVAGAVGKTAFKAGKYALQKKKKIKPTTQQTTKDTPIQQRLLPGSTVKGNLPPSKSPSGLLEPSSGQRARRDPAFKKREIEKRGGSVSEEFSCWREEFIYELRDLREKSREKKKDDEDRTVDVMPKNKRNTIIIGPNVTENYKISEMAPIVAAIGRIATTRVGSALASKAGEITADLIKNKMEKRFRNEPEDVEPEIQKISSSEPTGSAFQKAIGNVLKVKENYEIVEEKVKKKSLLKRIGPKVADAALTASFLLPLADPSGRGIVRSMAPPSDPHGPSSSMQLMDRMMRKRKEANRNLDHGRVVPRNVKEGCGCENIKKDMIKSIIVKAINEKKRKNALINNKYIGENVDKSAMKCNKPKAQAHGSGETGKSHIVKACVGGKEKIIRFGQLGVKGSPKKKGESKAYASRRRRFQTRHAKNIARGPMSAAYWANKVKW